MIMTFKGLADNFLLDAARHANLAAALPCQGLGCVAPIPTAAQVMTARDRFA